MSGRGNAVRGFDPAEPRDPDGKWMRGAGAVGHMLKDLKDVAVSDEGDGNTKVSFAGGPSFTLSGRQTTRLYDVLNTIGGDVDPGDPHTTYEHPAARKTLKLADGPLTVTAWGSAEGPNEDYKNGTDRVRIEHRGKYVDLTVNDQPTPSSLADHIVNAAPEELQASSRDTQHNAQPWLTRGRTQMAVSDKPWSQFSQADYTPEQWRRACLVDTGNGAVDSKDRYKLPVREPDGTLNRNGVHAAAGGHGIGQVEGISPDTRRAAARKLVSAYKECGDEPPQSLLQMAGMSMSMMDNSRSEEPSPWSDMIVRSMELDDLSLKRGSFSCERCGKDATGRMVDAYATVFNTSAEISDQHGHYHEVIDPSAFNMVLGRAKDMRNIGVYYHHGMTLHGTPSGEGTYPLGHPSIVRADRHGLFTSTHYSTNDVGERALQLIKEGTLTGMSFQGRIYRSDPNRIPAQRRGGPLPTVRRLQLGLREYGPTPSPAYAEAQVAAVRAAMQEITGQPSAGHAGLVPPLPSYVDDGAEDMREALSRRQRILRLRAEEHFRRALTNG